MIPRATALTMCLLLIAAVASAGKIKTAQNPEADFSQFRTYAWKPQAGSVADTQVRRDVRRNVEGVLRDKGLAKVESDPDVWVEFVIGSADMLRVEWRLAGVWGSTLYFKPGARSRLEAGMLLVVSANGRGTSEDQPVWGGRVVLAGNNPDSLAVMAGMAGKQARKLMKKYPGMR